MSLLCASLTLQMGLSGRVSVEPKWYWSKNQPTWGIFPHAIEWYITCMAACPDGIPTKTVNLCSPTHSEWRMGMAEGTDVMTGAAHAVVDHRCE